MSVITVQIGQCGNQIGEKFFETIISDCFEYKLNKQQTNVAHFKKLNEYYLNECKQRFFTENENCQDQELKSNKADHLLYARSVLIDMESKVVNKLLYSASNSKCIFRESNSYTQKKGSGNNWSYGYCINGPNSIDKIEDIIRKESERCDRLSSFLVCMSLAGGTGSGVGSYYTEFLRDQYPRTTIVNTCVWPFSTGEVILQNYNFLLTLNKLYEYSDALILLENDILHQICKRINNSASSSSSTSTNNQTRNTGQKEITFNDLNSIIGHKLASVMQPSLEDNSRKNYLNEIVGDLCASNDFKLLSLNNVPIMSKQSIEYSTFQWNGLYKNARQLLYTGGYMDEGLAWNTDSNNPNEFSNKTLALSLFARGMNSSLEEHEDLKNNYFDGHYLRKHFSNDLFGSLLYRPIRLWHQNRAFNNYEKSLSLLSNSQLPAYKIETLVSKAWRMFSARAYVHQYVKYDNFEEEHLLNAFIFAEQLIKNYKNL